MSMFLVLITMLNSLERMKASFFWGADLDDRRMHWVKWDRIVASRDDGGMGVWSVFAYNRALLL